MENYYPKTWMQIKINVPFLLPPKKRNAYAVSIEGVLPKAMFSEEMAIKAGKKIIENNFYEERKLRKIEELKYNISFLKETIPTIKNPLAKVKRKEELYIYVNMVANLENKK